MPGDVSIRGPSGSRRRRTMRFGPFLGLAILLLILWAGGFVFYHVAGFLIHLLLIFAVISFVLHLFMGSRTA
jgi:Family of unknown function (DUF5670)